MGKLGAGIVSAYTLPTMSLIADPMETIQQNNSRNKKKIRIGIIGAENSHTAGFGKIFNIEKKFPGVEVKYVWGETDELARKAAAKGVGDKPESY